MLGFAAPFFVVADEASGGGTAVLGADLVAPFELQNGPDSVVLRQGVSVLDAVNSIGISI